MSFSHRISRATKSGKSKKGNYPFVCSFICFLLLNFGILGVLAYQEWMTLSGAPALSIIPRQQLNLILNDWKVFSDWYTIGNRLINEVTTFPSLCCLLIDYAREHQFKLSLKCQSSLLSPPSPNRRPWIHLSSVGTKTAYQTYSSPLWEACMSKLALKGGRNSQIRR